MSLGSLLKPSGRPCTLRATGSGVQTINLLPMEQTGCLTLMVSFNCISSLENIGQFRHLTSLLIEYNNICYIEDLAPLATLRFLTILSLEGNPVCQLPLWDIHVIKLCPKLKMLNGKKVAELYGGRYTRRELFAFLTMEEKFHEGFLNCRFMLRTLRQKLKSRDIQWRTVRKMVKTQMFSDPGCAAKNAHRIRQKAAGQVKIESYFAFMRQKLLAKHYKIQELLAQLRVRPDFVHDFMRMVTRMGSSADFGVFVNELEGARDMYLSEIGMDDKPSNVVVPRRALSRSSARSAKKRESRVEPKREPEPEPEPEPESEPEVMDEDMAMGNAKDGRFDEEGMESYGDEEKPVNDAASEEETEKESVAQDEEELGHSEEEAEAQLEEESAAVNEEEEMAYEEDRKSEEEEEEVREAPKRTRRPDSILESVLREADELNRGFMSEDCFESTKRDQTKMQESQSSGKGKKYGESMGEESNEEAHWTDHDVQNEAEYSDKKEEECSGDASSQHEGYSNDGDQKQEAYSEDADQRPEGYSEEANRAQEGYSEEAHQRPEGYSEEAHQRQEGYSEEANRTQEGYSEEAHPRPEGYSEEANRTQEGYSEEANRAQEGYSEEAHQRQEGYSEEEGAQSNASRDASAHDLHTEEEAFGENKYDDAEEAEHEYSDARERYDTAKEEETLGEEDVEHQLHEEYGSEESVQEASESNVHHEPEEDKNERSVSEHSEPIGSEHEVPMENLDDEQQGITLNNLIGLSSPEKEYSHAASEPLAEEEEMHEYIHATDEEEPITHHASAEASGADGKEPHNIGEEKSIPVIPVIKQAAESDSLGDEYPLGVYDESSADMDSQNEFLENERLANDNVSSSLSDNDDIRQPRAPTAEDMEPEHATPPVTEEEEQNASSDAQLQEGVTDDTAFDASRGGESNVISEAIQKTPRDSDAPNVSKSILMESDDAQFSSEGNKAPHKKGVVISLNQDMLKHKDDGMFEASRGESMSEDSSPRINNHLRKDDPASRMSFSSFVDDGAIDRAADGANKPARVSSVSFDQEALAEGRLDAKFADEPASSEILTVDGREHSDEEQEDDELSDDEGGNQSTHEVAAHELAGAGDEDMFQFEAHSNREMKHRGATVRVRMMYNVNDLLFPFSFWKQRYLDERAKHTIEEIKHTRTSARSELNAIQQQVHTKRMMAFRVREQEAPSRRDKLKELAERHELIKLIDRQKGIVRSLKDRLSQLRKETDSVSVFTPLVSNYCAVVSAQQRARRRPQLPDEDDITSRYRLLLGGRPRK